MKRLWEKYTLHFRIKVQIPAPTLGLRESLPEQRRPISEWGVGRVAERARNGSHTQLPHQQLRVLRNRGSPPLLTSGALPAPVGLDQEEEGWGRGTAWVSEFTV